MKLLLIAGFLGSGKTTLLLEVARKRAITIPYAAAVLRSVIEIGNAP